MKYFAILKDSFRETIDSKVLYVLLGLSMLVILFVLSLSFTPLSAHQTFEQFIKGDVRNVFSTEARTRKRMAFADQAGDIKLEKVDLLDGKPDAPLSTYALTVVRSLKISQEKALEEVHEVFKEAQERNFITVQEVRAVSDHRILITVKGTANTFRVWKNNISFLFGAVTPVELSNFVGVQIFILAQLVVSFGSWVAVLMGVVITSFFIPNMLRKGTVDLLLVKPIERWTLLLYKYIGGLMFIFLSTSFAIGGIWLALGVRTGMWRPEPLLIVPTITFFFAILYAISTFVAVLTRSTITCILLTCAAWFLFSIIGSVDQYFRAKHLVEQFQGTPEDKRMGDGRLAHFVRAVYAITPRTTDLDGLNSLFIASGYLTGSLDLDDLGKLTLRDSPWWENAIISGTWIVVFVGASCLWFAKKDY